MEKIRVLVAAGDERAREVLSGLLRNDPAGYEVLARGAAPGAFIELPSVRPHLIVMHASGNGAEYAPVIKTLRATDEGNDAGVLVVVPAGDNRGLEALLHAGANGVLPGDEVSADALCTRTRNVLEHVLPRWRTRRACGSLVLSMAERSVEVGSRRLPLSPALFDSLHRLVASRGSVVSYHDQAGADEGVPAARARSRAKARISRLRKLLGPLDCCIESARGVGYRLLDGPDEG